MSVTSTVYYLTRKPIYETVKPYFCYMPPDTLNGFPITNQEYSPVKVTIRDIRDYKGEHDTESFALDRNGFEVLNHELDSAYNFDSMHDDPDLVKKYESVIEKLLQAKTGAKKVVVFDHEMRRRNPEFPGAPGKSSALEQPVRGVHIDSSPASALERAVYHCNNTEDRHLLQGRIQIINTWRPLFSPLLDWPLAVCDSRSISIDDDLVPSDSVFPDSSSETLQVFQSASHRWWFLSGQTRNELLMFKIFDTDEDQARFCPHASFDWAEQTGGQPRESVETRALIFYGAE